MNRPKAREIYQQMKAGIWYTRQQIAAALGQKQFYDNDHSCLAALESEGYVKIRQQVSGITKRYEYKRIAE